MLKCPNCGHEWRSLTPEADKFVADVKAALVEIRDAGTDRALSSPYNPLWHKAFIGAKKIIARKSGARVTAVAARCRALKLEPALREWWLRTRP